jgi:hypothetical protein
VRYLWPALLLLLFAVGCSSGSSGKKPTPSSTESPTTPVATRTVDPRAPSATPPVGTPIASGTLVTSAGAGVDPAVAQEVIDTIRRQIEALNAGKLDEAYNFYSACVKKKLTKDNLAFGRTATGTVTLLRVSVASANDRAAVAEIETQTKIFVGNQNHFKSNTNLVRENGAWKIDSQTPAECGR